MTHNYTVTDVTAPVITLTTPAANATFTRNQAVNANYSCADEPGGSGIATCAGTAANGTAIDTSTIGPHSFTVDATDNAGNPASVTHNYTVTDVTAPVITLTTPAANATYAQGATVNAAFSCADEPGGSGIATCVGSVANNTAIDTSTLGSHSFTVDATDNAGNPSSVTHNYTVTDQTDPLVTLDTPPDGAGITYIQDEVVDASFSCTDTNLVSCVGDVAVGDPIDTATLGEHSFTVTGTDGGGNTTEVTHSYTVISADQIDPFVAIYTPANGDGTDTYTQGDSVLASFVCYDDDVGSGIATCVGTLDGNPIADGDALDTSTLGEHSFSVTATDYAGNSHTESTTYTVEAAPVSAGPMVIPAGHTVHFTGITFSACNNLTWGYQINSDDPVIVASGAAACGFAFADDLVIGPFPSDVTLRVFLDDDTCGGRFWSDDVHAFVTEIGTGYWNVAIVDAGGNCESPPNDPRPPGSGNLNLYVEAVPPDLSS